MWGRILWLALISLNVEQLGCHVVYHGSYVGKSQDGRGGIGVGPSQYLHKDENANGRSVWNKTVHSSPDTAGRVKRQSPDPVPDINIIYKFKEGETSADPLGLSCSTGDLTLTLQTGVVPSYSNSLQFSGNRSVETATLKQQGIPTKGVGCKTDTDISGFYNASAPVLPRIAQYVPEALSITINKGQDLEVNFESVTGAQEVVWNKIPGRWTDGKRGRISDLRLTIPYLQLDGSGMYEIGEYSAAPGYSPPPGKIGIISLLERECPEGMYGPPACDNWCKDCMYGGVCHDHTGECVCPPGLSGAYCETRCPDGRIGRDCGVLLESDQFTAVCLPHPLGCHCLPGYKGFKCQEKCLNYVWGIDCSNRCSSNCQYNCDKVTGKCSNQQQSACNQGTRGLPRLRKPPTVTNTNTGNILVQFLEWDSNYDDGEMLQGDELKYWLQYWAESNKQNKTYKAATPPSIELTDLIPLTRYNMKVLVEVTRLGQSCMEFGSAGSRVHTIPFKTPCPTYGQPSPANLRTTDVQSDSASIHWDTVAYVQECGYQYHFIITPANGGQTLVDEKTQGTFWNVDQLDINTKYNVGIQVVGLVRVTDSWSTTAISKARTTTFTTRPPKPAIISMITSTHISFTIRVPAGSSDDLQYSLQLQNYRKACSSILRPTWSSWSDWTPWSLTSNTIRRQRSEIAYSNQTLRAKFRNTAWEGPFEEKSQEVPPEVPLLAIVNLNCDEHGPRSCYVKLETDCQKENGPDLTVSYDLMEDGKQPVIAAKLPLSSVDYRGQASIPTHLNELPAYTWITMKAYPANSVGRNPHIMKTDLFRTPPKKPGKVSNMQIHVASEAITVTWEKPEDNPPRGELERYKVEWKLMDRRYWNPRNVKYPNSNTHRHTITGLINDKEYEIRVSAKNEEVEEYGEHEQRIATPKEGKPSPVIDLMVANETQTSVTVAWREPAHGTIEKYIVNLVKDAKGNILISKNITEKIYKFTDLQEGSAYKAEVMACNAEFCSDPWELEFWTRPMEPEVRGEPKVLSSNFSSVTIQLPVLDNPPGYQWILLKNFSVGEYSDDENHKSLKKEATDLVNKTESQSDSGRRRRDVNDGEHTEAMRVAARISQHKGSLTKEFTIGDNKTYDNYMNEPLEKESTHWMVLVTERKAGTHRELNVSPPIKIRAVPDSSTIAFVSTLISLLLLVILVMLVVVVVFYKKHRSKLRTGYDGTDNTDLVTYTDGNENPNVNIVDVNGQQERPRCSPLVPSNPSSVPSVLVAEEEYPNHVAEVQEEIAYPEQVTGAEEGEENQDECIYMNLCSRIAQDDLEAYLSRAMFSPDTDQEFSNVPYIMPKSCSDGEQAVNRKKNRYKNNLPYNDTRVKLPLVNNEPDTDYINACYVMGPGNPQAFIATQGPKDYEKDTTGDFWRMIWHTKCYTIVMVVNLIENGKVKVAKYWPNSDEQMVKDDMIIQLYKQEVKLGFHVRNFSVTKGDEVRQIVQYHYTDWPDHGVPQNPFGLAQMLKLMRSTAPQGPITVHCSAGIGRTGTVILVLYLLRELEATKHLSPGNALVALRGSRPRLVENTAQYKFGHSLLHEILFGVETSIACSSYVAQLPQVRATPVLSNQYTKLKSLPKDLNFKFAKKPEFANLNRNPDILPADSRLVFLQNVSGNSSSQYVNVVRVNGLDRTDAYLAGEHPQEHTVEAVWRLVMERRVSVWIHLHTFPNSDPEYPELLFCQGTEKIGMMKLTVGPTHTFQNFKECAVDIIPTNSRLETSHRVVLLQLQGWPHTLSVPEQPTALLAVLEKAESLLSSTSPILFTCKDGVAGCGVATALLLARSRAQLIQEVDVYRSVLSILYDRPQFITSYEQYDFVHSAMQMFIAGNSHYGNFA